MSTRISSGNIRTSARVSRSAARPRLRIRRPGHAIRISPIRHARRSPRRRSRTRVSAPRSPQVFEHTPHAQHAAAGYSTLRSPRSQSPRYPKAEFQLAPLSEERSSGRERSQSEQIPTAHIQQFEVAFSLNEIRRRTRTITCVSRVWLPYQPGRNRSRRNRWSWCKEEEASSPPSSM